MKKAAFLLAMAGFILMLGSFGQADCGASIGSILPTTVAGVFMMAGGTAGTQTFNYAKRSGSYQRRHKNPRLLIRPSAHSPLPPIALANPAPGNGVILPQQALQRSLTTR